MKNIKITFTSLIFVSILASTLVFADEPVKAPAVDVAAPIDSVTLRQNAETQKVIIQRQDIENMGISLH